MSKAQKKGSDSMREAVKSLQRTVSDTIEAKEPKGDARGMRRQTLYLPPAVHEQLRHLAVRASTCFSPARVCRAGRSLRRKQREASKAIGAGGGIRAGQ